MYEKKRSIEVNKESWSLGLQAGVASQVVTPASGEGHK